MKIFTATLLLLLPLLGKAQTTTATTGSAPAVNSNPTYTYAAFVGGGYTQNAVPQAGQGAVQFDIGLGSGMYSITRVNVYKANSTLTTGFKKKFAQIGNVQIFGVLMAGITTGTPVIGNFLGGAEIQYTPSWLKGLTLSSSFNIQGASAASASQPQQVTPAVFLMIGKEF